MILSNKTEYIDFIRIKFEKISIQLVSISLRNHKLILIFAFCYFFSNCFFGLDLTDGFFHINAATLINGNYPFETILTGQILHFFYSIAGKHFIVYRLFNSLLILTGFLIISTFFGRDLKISVRNLLLASLIIIGSPITNNILGYDTFSLWMLIVIVSFMIKCKIDNLKNITILSFLIAVFALIRIPNATILAFIPVYLYKFHYDNSWSLKKIIGIYFSITSLSSFFFLLYITINYGSLSKGFASFSSVDDHNIFELLQNYLRDFTRIVCYLLLTISSYYFIVNKKSNLLLLFLIQSIFIIFFVLNTPYVWNYTLFVTAFNYSFIFILFLKEKKINYLYLFALLTTFVISIGSNTGLSKTSTFGTFGLLFCMESFKRIDRQYLISWLLILIPFSFFENAGWTYEDGNLYQLRKPINIEGLNPIITTGKHYKYIHAVTEKSEILKKQGYQVFYYGYYSHLFTFLNPIKRETYSFDQRFGSPKEMQNILNECSNKKSAVVLTDNIGYQKRKETSTAENLLLTNGFSILNDDRFTIYLNSK